jgi:hypothetical protein
MQTLIVLLALAANPPGMTTVPTTPQGTALIQGKCINGVCNAVQTATATVQAAIERQQRKPRFPRLAKLLGRS